MRHFVYVTKGTEIRLKNPAYHYRYAFFTLKRPGRYLYTYDYQEQECWCTYSEELSCRNWLQEDRMFDENCLPPDLEGYIRLEISRENVYGDEAAGADIQERDVFDIHYAVTEESFLARKTSRFLNRRDVRTEIEKTVSGISRCRKEHSLVFTLLADSHYVINGNWEYTAAAIEAVNERIGPDGIIHLGDLTDGLLDKETCREYSSRILNSIRAWGLLFYLTIGNHDSNYFRGNPDVLSDWEQYEYYLKDRVSGRLTEGQLWYYQDFPDQRLRMLFLHSYDNREKLRYGFSEREISWVGERLEELPGDYCVILFSHEAPVARLDYWASEIRGGARLMEVLERWQEQHDNRILAFIHGHTHADYIYGKRGFPIISVGCSKIEYFSGKKPQGAVRQMREERTVWQELWDTMIINTEERKIDFVRFGAGMDRSVEQNRSLQGMQLAGGKKPEIWAHRGASGYAPENTLEAFRLAVMMKAQGVELDVQFTKDMQLVVIHDETINRTSDGTGYVAEFTLKELRKFNYNRTHPEFSHTDIPTLKEVLELFAPTEMTVNIELKTGVRFYPGIEEAVVKVVQECGMQGRVIYSSFNHASVLRVREYDPDARLGFLYSDGTLNMPNYAKAQGMYALHPAFYNMKYPGFPEQCRENGIRLHVWTVNDEAAMEEMEQLGADSIITNYPDIAREVFYGEKVHTEELLSRMIVRQEESGGEQPEIRKKKGILHLMGLCYGVVRKGFVAIDRQVQRAAGKT